MESSEGQNRIELVTGLKILECSLENFNLLEFSGLFSGDCREMCTRFDSNNVAAELGQPHGCDSATGADLQQTRGAINPAPILDILKQCCGIPRTNGMVVVSEYVE